MNFIINVQPSMPQVQAVLTAPQRRLCGDMPCERDPGADDNRQREWANAAGADPTGCVRRHAVQYFGLKSSYFIYENAIPSLLVLLYNGTLSSTSFHC